jgi:hypothetical protein
VTLSFVATNLLHGLHHCHACQVRVIAACCCVIAIMFIAQAIVCMLNNTKEKKRKMCHLRESKEQGKRKRETHK